MNCLDHCLKCVYSTISVNLNLLIHILERWSQDTNLSSLRDYEVLVSDIVNTGHVFRYRLLSATQKLKVLHMSHNLLTELPSEVGAAVLEELSLERNQLMQLPDDLFVNLAKYVTVQAVLKLNSTKSFKDLFIAKL